MTASLSPRQWELIGRALDTAPYGARTELDTLRDALLNRARITLYPTPDACLLSEAIDAADLSVRSFAKHALQVDERAVFRWLNGDEPMPEHLRTRCRLYIVNEDDKG